MNARNQPQPDTTPQPTEPKAKHHTAAIRAANAFNRILKLRIECEAEIAASPESIRRKFAERIAAVAAGLDGDAKVLLEKLTKE